MGYAVVLSGIFAVHVLAMISPGPNVLIVSQTAISHTRRAGIATALAVATGWHVALACLFSTRRAQHVYRGIKRWADRIAGASLAFLGLRPMLPSR